MEIKDFALLFFSSGFFILVLVNLEFSKLCKMYQQLTDLKDDALRDLIRKNLGLELEKNKLIDLTEKQRKEIKNLHWRIEEKD